MIIAIVNGYEITDREYQAEILKTLRESNNNQITREKKAQALNNLIEAALVLQEAQKYGISIPNDDLEQEILDFMIQFENEQEYLNMLKSSQQSMDAIRTYLNNKLLVKKYLTSVVNDSNFKTPDEEQLLAFYQENLDSFTIEEVIKVSHILIDRASGREKAELIRSKIKTSEDFHAVAARCSECPSCCQAGDLGYIRAGQMVKEFDAVAFKLRLNEISQPVETIHGFHIIMLTDHKEKITIPFDEAKEALIKRLRRIEYELNVLHHMKSLRDSAELFINDEIFEQEIIL